MVSFGERWKAAVEEKGSVLCAGLDPADFRMGRGKKGLPEGVDKRDWALRYVEAVAPYCAAVKPNFQYWKDRGDVVTLMEISLLAHNHGMIVIDDSKLADIGSTNEAGVIYAARRGAHAVTIAPYAGNMEEINTQCENNRIGAITMCLMSNKEYEAEKNHLVPVDSNHGYRPDDVIDVAGQPHVKKYMTLANRARLGGIDAMVIGAPSEDNHLTEDELKTARHYAGDDVLVLLPGVGHQGGEAGLIWKAGFAPNNVIVNVGRALMFPKEGEWNAMAKHYRDTLNDLIKAAA